MTALTVDQVAEPYIRRRALRHLEKDRIIILAGGTGSPYFSTDTTSALRGAELDAEVILMAKNGVDGVYDKDPRKHDCAVMLDKITHLDVVKKRLMVMDLTAATMCKDNDLDIVVFNMNVKGNIKKAVLKNKIGTTISGAE
jgi:uridylate kinase